MEAGVSTTKTKTSMRTTELRTLRMENSRRKNERRPTLLFMWTKDRPYEQPYQFGRPSEEIERQQAVNTPKTHPSDRNKPQTYVEDDEEEKIGLILIQIPYIIGS